MPKMSTALFKDGEFDLQLALYLEASGSILAGDASVRYETDDMNVYGNAEFAVGHGEAKLDAAIGKIQNQDGSVSYGAKVSAGAEVCAVQGEVEGGFDLFGIKVKAKAKGKAGALSAKGDAALTTDGIECSASLAVLFGGELSLAVDWSEFELPEINWSDVKLPKDWWPF